MAARGRLIAISGKGGSGKSTVAALLLRQFLRAGMKPILAVDADPNATLGLTLGAEPADTIADLRDRMGDAAQEVTEIPKGRLLDQWLAEVLQEETGFDLLTMGRPEGPKCYCYVNGLLRRYLKELRGNYPAVIVDCEAGMEYLSRLTVDDIDALVLVAEATRVGLTSAGRIARLSAALPIRVKRRVLVVNKVPPERLGQPDVAGDTEWRRDLEGLRAEVRVPFDEDLHRRAAGGLAVDEAAGPLARPAIEYLARVCLNDAG